MIAVLMTCVLILVASDVRVFYSGDFRLCDAYCMDFVIIIKCKQYYQTSQQRVTFH